MALTKNDFVSSKSKSAKKENKKDIKTDDRKKKLRKIQDSDSESSFTDMDSDEEEFDEDDDDEDDDDDDDFIDDEEEEEMDRTELRKYLSKIFPSKYMNKKVKADEKAKKQAKINRGEHDDDDEDDDDEDDEDEEDQRPNKKSSKTKNKNVVSKKSTKQLTKSKNLPKNLGKNSPKKSKIKKHESNKKRAYRYKREDDDNDDEDDEDEDDDDEDEDDEDEDDEDYDDDDEDEALDKNKVNIIFTIGGGDDEDDEYFDTEDMDESNEDENESVDEETYMKDSGYQNVVIPPEEEKPVVPEKEKKPKKNKKDPKSPSKKEQETEEMNDIETEYMELLDLKKHLTEKLVKKPNSKILRKAITECSDSIHQLIKTARSKNTKSYHKLIYGDRKKTNEVDYFKKKLTNKEQLKIMNELKEINECIYIEKPYRLSLLQSKMPPKYKAFAMQKLNYLRTMEPGDPEYHKIKNWVDNFMKIPFGVYKSLSVSMSDGVEVCNDFLVRAKQTLDECAYGLENAKMQSLQMIGQWISNPQAMGSAIAITGPMGTGKTTLIKDGISKILGREFAFIALGGAGDGSFLEGHSYTYEGSVWGKIVQILMDNKCMNPVIYFDELDKVSDTPRGQEIIGILTHLTDTSQNSQYHDKYFSEIDFDLSKCLFIFSYNDENLVNPILRDRMYKIQTKGYETKDKIVIARNYLLPKIREQVNFKEDEIIIPDDTLQYIISNEEYTKKEDGVRNLKRCLEIIYTKLNLFRLIKPDNTLFAKQINLDVKFPFTVTRKDVSVLIKNDENQKQSLLAMYV
jgi:ATP-dependent Lon protease